MCAYYIVLYINDVVGPYSSSFYMYYIEGLYLYGGTMVLHGVMNCICCLLVLWLIIVFVCSAGVASTLPFCLLPTDIKEMNCF